MKIAALCIASLPLAAVAFAPRGGNDVADLSSMIALNAESFATPTPTKPIFDPLGLYPRDSPERVSGLIVPLEISPYKSNDDDDVVETRDVVDPLRLYGDQSQVSKNVDMSMSLPFLRRPALLDGRTLPGDRGFDPFNLASSADALMWQRKAEIKHARLAMLACAGWISAELLHGPLSTLLDMPYMLASGDRVPSILNDGLSHAGSYPVFWIATIALSATLEFGESADEMKMSKLDPSDLGFDPLGFMNGKTNKQKFFLKEAEIFYGRLGMLAITGFAIQEYFLGSAVVNMMPFERMRELML
jgi:hypothetical protein